MPSPPTLNDRLDAVATANPDREAFVGRSGAVTYAALAEDVRATAASLVAAGLSPRATVGIECADEPRHLVLTLAVARAGAASITLATTGGASERGRLASLAGATARLGAEGELAPLGPDAEREPAPLATLLFSTSGTTGAPKIVRHSSAGIVAQAHRHVGRDERFACLASVEHNFAKRHRLYCIAEGGTNVFLEADLARVPEQLRKYGASTLHLSVFQAQELLDLVDGRGLGSIRLKLGGSHVAGELRRRLRERLSPSLECGYGTTETGAIAFTEPDGAGAVETVGRPLAGIEVRVVDGAGRALGVGERGELHIRGAGQFLGYLGDGERTRQSLVDGWFHTGDVGLVDGAGRIHLSGRVDDMFVFNSMNIFPQDLESVLRTHPSVVDVAVGSRPSPVHGAVPVALVVLAAGAGSSLAELASFARAELGLRAPRRFKRVEALPRNRGGKLLRDAAERLAATDDGTVRATVAAAFEGSGVAARLAAGELDRFRARAGDIEFDAIDLDSLERMDLLVALELEHGVVISPGHLARLHTVEEVVGLVLERAGREDSPSHTGGPATLEPSDLAPVRWLRRVANGVATIAEFHQMLERFDERLTPAEVARMISLHRDRRLVAGGAIAGLDGALDEWAERCSTLMAASGKSRPEPFHRRRPAPGCYAFEGPGARSDKTLLVCFATKGRRTLFLPQATLLQHLDAERHDALILSDVWDNGFRRGAPLMGTSVHGILAWVAAHPQLAGYRAVRVLGCSAGAYPALLLGRTVDAELTLCVSGRFPAERHFGQFCGMHLNPLVAFARNRRARTILAHVKSNRRDTVFAQRMGRLTRSSRVSLAITGEGIRHNFLLSLAWGGHLADFLARTILAPVGSGLAGAQPVAEALVYDGDGAQPADHGPEGETSRFARPPATTGA